MSTCGHWGCSFGFPPEFIYLRLVPISRFLLTAYRNRCAHNPLTYHLLRFTLQEARCVEDETSLFWRRPEEYVLMLRSICIGYGASSMGGGIGWNAAAARMVFRRSTLSPLFGWSAVVRHQSSCLVGRVRRRCKPSVGDMWNARHSDVCDVSQ